MNAIPKRTARAMADSDQGRIFASVDIAVPPERVFRAIASKEIISWWVRPGVFDTREWTGDVRVGGRWKSSGLFRGDAYTLEGEFLEVDPPRKLVLTWESARSAKPSTLTYLLEPVEGGTRLTLRHSGLAKEQCADMQAGWESSFDALLAILPPI